MAAFIPARNKESTQISNESKPRKEHFLTHGLYMWLYGMAQWSARVCLVNSGQYKGLWEFEGVKLNCVDREETLCWRALRYADVFLQQVKTTELS